MVQRALDNVSLAVNRGAAGGEVRLLTRFPLDAHVLKLFGEYLLLELSRSDKTVRGYSQQLAAVGKMLGKPICAVSVEDVRFEVKRDEDIALSTRQLRVAAFRQLHMWGLLEKEKWADPAMLGVKSIKEPKRLPRPPISLLDARKLLSNCHTPNEYRVVYLPLVGQLEPIAAPLAVSLRPGIHFGNP